MDSRFPRYLRALVDKLDFLSLPNLGMLIAGLAVLGFVGQNILNAPMERFLFSPEAVAEGEYWRLFAFPILNNPLFLLFFCLYAYFIFGMLQTSWGEAPTTIYTLLSYLSGIGASFYAGASLSIWENVLTNVSLAFGTLFPEMEFYLFFLLPVKAKWLAAFAGAIFIYQFVVGGFHTKVFLLIMLSPYLLFFGPLLYHSAKMWWRSRNSRGKFGG